MKLNKWTMALASAGVVSFVPLAQAEEAMSPVLTAVSSTTISGYVDTSWEWQPGTGNEGPGTDQLPGRFNDGSSKVDGFNLNVVGLTIEKPLGDENWAAGYKFQMLYGPDAVGYNPSANGDQNEDFAIKNANVTVRFPTGNGIDMTLGVFDTIIGYEVFESYLNPNFGRSYGWNLEPTQHTGMLLNYAFSESIAVVGGIANTLTPGINTRSPKGENQYCYMGAVSLTAPDSWGWLSGANLYAGAMTGWAGNSVVTTDPANPLLKNTINTYIGAVVPMPVDTLSLGVAFDNRLNGAVVNSENWAWATALYLNWEATEKVTISARGDFTAGSDGTWFTSTRANNPSNRLFATTLTMDYALWANVLARLEARWDTSLSGDNPYGTATDPEKNALTFLANLVYVF